VDVCLENLDLRKLLVPVCREPARCEHCERNAAAAHAVWRYTATTDESARSEEETVSFSRKISMAALCITNKQGARGIRYAPNLAERALLGEDDL
jgi:hypothetical protein